ncbi:hypothetical protein F4823DRAFT_621211 [Ustulina deusta]|nr:hypothetical protein F4823DRAFT_621211 [Ustulina deusta]
MNEGFALSEALSLLEIEDALGRIKTQSHRHANSLAIEGNLWLLKYQKTMTDGDLEMAVTVSKAALQEMDPNTTSNNSLIFDSVSNAHYFKFRRTGLLGDINTAIETCVLAMGTDALTTQQRWALETKLATYMLDRTELFPTAEHRLEAISHHRKYSEMEGLCPSGRARFLSQFGVSLSRQYLISGDSRLLDEALRLGYESTDSSNLQDPKQADIEFSNIASTLFMSFRHTQRFSDLEAALQISQLAIDNEVRDDMLERAGMLVTRGGMLTTKYQRYRNTKPEVAQEALDEAIKHGRRAALILKPVGPSSEAFQIHRKSNLLNSIAPWFVTKMMLTGTVDWGQEGITLLREALELRQEDHPERLSILARLSHILEVQHQVLKSQKDTQAALARLEEALKCGTEAAEATPELDSDRGERYMCQDK